MTLKGGCFLINTEEKTVAIIYRKSKNDYSFPKGHMEEGEDVKACAIRETIEETQRDVELLLEDPIYKNTYKTSAGEDVEVDMYLAKDKGEYKGFINEIDKEDCQWIKFDDVHKFLSYDDLKEMWNDVKLLIKPFME